MKSNLNKPDSEQMLLEQYKVYVQSADNVSSRRGQTNSLFVSILSGVLALLSIAVGTEIVKGIQNITIVAVAILGLFLCILWFINIHSYKRLNSAKYRIIHEMEQHLAFHCFDKEWEILKDKKRKRYFQLTEIEQYVPIVFAIPYLLLLVYSLFAWTNAG